MKTWQQNSASGLREEHSDGDDDIFSGGGVEEEIIDDSSQEQGDLPEASAKSAFDYEALARANAENLRPILESFRPQQQTPQLSQAELNKMLARFDPDDELVEAMWGEGATKESRAAGLKRMIDGIYGHVYKSTGMFVQEQLGGVQKELEPFKADRAKREYNDFKTELVKGNPWMKEFSKLHDHAIQAVASSGQQFKSNKEAQNAIAAYVETLVKQANPNFIRPQSQNQGQRNMPRIAGSAGGGGGGGAGSGAGGRGQQKAWQGVLVPQR